jgi:hypothetical protein
MKMGDAEREIYTNGICFTLQVTDYFMHQLSEADWLTRAHNSRCTKASNTWPLSLVSVTLKPVMY